MRRRIKKMIAGNLYQLQLVLFYTESHDIKQHQRVQLCYSDKISIFWKKHLTDSVHTVKKEVRELISTSRRHSASGSPRILQTSIYSWITSVR